MCEDKFDINVYYDEVNRALRDIEGITDGPTRTQKALALRTEVEGYSHLLPRYQLLSYSAKIQSLLNSTEAVQPKRRSRFTDKMKEARTQGTARLKEAKVFEEESVVPDLTQSHGEVWILPAGKPMVSEVSEGILVTHAKCYSATFKYVKNCILIINADGPVFLHECHNCLIFIDCHQLRIHDSSELKIDAHIPSGRAIIEHCRKMKFKGVDVDDFDHPNGRSTSFSTFKLPDELEGLDGKIRGDPTAYIGKLQRFLSLC